MSNNKLWRRRGRGSGSAHGNGREGGDDECSEYNKKVQPATLGDAFLATRKDHARSRKKQPRQGSARGSNTVTQHSPPSTSQPRTPPREQEKTQQPTTSSDSNGTMASNRSMKGAELSYSAAVSKSPKHEQLWRNLLQFLKTFTVDGEYCPYYKAEVHATMLRSPFSLTIQFSHMLKHDNNLAFETWNYLGNMRVWILPAVREFLKFHNYGSEADIMSKTKLEPSGFPSSMKKVVDVLKSATHSLGLLRGEGPVWEAKSEARLVVQLFFIAVFACHQNGLSWDGKFSVGDMLLVDNKELLITQPCVLATGDSRLRDIQKGVKQLLPFFKGSDGCYPAYFLELVEDIQNATSSEIKESWCIEYFTYHMASLPSYTRRCFELSLHSILKNIDIAIELDYIFGVSVHGFTDWQADIENSGCKVLKDVLDYIDPATAEKVKYGNNIGGLVKYKRHFIEHARFGLCFDINEPELIGANKFPKHLPGAVKLLLKEHKMETCFGTPWSSLRSSCRDKRVTPAKK